MAGFGGTAPKSQEQKALDATKTSNYSFVNKDFTRNMALLNQTVDIHTDFLNKLQKGVDSANLNPIEQIQAFIADVFVIFAGLEPDGIFEFGNLKYVFQGLGAMFGINPSTPFPLNIIDAVGHFFGNWIAPLEQFTDLVFDSVTAWAHALGFSDEFLDAVGEFKDSIETLGSAIGDFFRRVLSLFDVFGFFNGMSGPLSGLMSGILDFFSDIVLPSLKPIMNVISSWTVPFVNALTGTFYTLSRLINGVPLGHITNKQVNIVAEAGLDAASSMQTGFGWSWDSTQGRTKDGAAKCVANGQIRQLVSGTIPVVENQNLNVGCWVKWTGLVYTGTAPVTLCINKYQDDDLVGVILITGVTSPAINQTTWFQYQGNYVVENDCNYVRISLRVNANATNGTVWFDDIDMHKEKDSLPQSWITNLIPDILGVNTFINNVIGTVIHAVRGIPLIGAGLADLFTWLTGWKAGTDATEVKATATKAGMEATREIVVATATNVPVATITGTLPDDDTVANALAAQTDTIIQQGAIIDQIQSQITAADNSGVKALDLFEEVSVGSLDPLYWSGAYIWEGAFTGPSMETADGHNANLHVSDNNNYTIYHRFIGDGAHTITNYQRVTATIASGLSYPGIGDGRRPQHAVYCRMSDDGLKWVRLSVDNVNRWKLEYANGAGVTGTLWDSGADYSIKNPGPGSSISIEAGVGANEYAYRLWRGNVAFKIVTDTSHLADKDQKGHGMGMRAAAGWIPGKYTQYSAVDNKPAVIPGYGFRIYRASTSIAATGSGSQITAFDTTDYDTDTAWDATNQQYTIPESGWWIFKTRCGLNSTQDNNALDPVVVDLRDDAGTILELGQAGLIRNGQWGGTSNDSVTGIFGPIPLAKGRIVTTYVNYARTSSARIQGDAAGTKTFFEGSLVSKGR